MVMMKKASWATLVAICLVGCSKKPAETSALAGKLAGQNLLLITLDTTRADRIGCYGHASAQTPTMDALATRGTLFENTYAQVPLTLPSHISIMTGRYPREHGVRDNGRNALGPTHPTLAAIFKERGYATGAFLASFVLDSRFGLDRGFDVYSDDMGQTTFTTQPLEWQQPADLVTDRALAWLETVKSKPFFSWIHYYDPHQPYLPPEEFRQPGVFPYDAEIAFVDTQIRRVMDWLEASKLTEKTLVIVLGDHGEAFGEHGEQGHSNFVYDGNIKVPFIVVHPTFVPAKRRVPALVAAFDLFPTVLELFGAKAPEKLLSRSLVRAFADTLEDASVYAESLFVFYSFGWAEQRTLITPQWKYISSAKPQLFDRRNDPLEKESVLAQQPRVAKRLEGELRDLYDRMPAGAGEGAKLGAEERRALAALGYAGGGAITKDEFLSEGLPDPKDLLHLLKHVKAAKELMETAVSEMDFQLILPLARNLVRESPNSQLFQIVLGTCALKGNEPEEALKAFDGALKIDVDNGQAWALKADALSKLNRLAEAEKDYQTALRLEDQSAEIHLRFGELLVRTGRPDEAIKQFQRATEIFPSFAAAHGRLGQLLKVQGRAADSERHLEEAVRLFQEAVGREPTSADVRFRLGHAYLQLDRMSEAVPELREALRLDPNHAEAILPLATALEASGSADESEQVLRAALAHPEAGPDAHHALGVLLNKRGQIPEAVDMYEKAVALRPGKILAVQDLVGFYLGQRRIADAIRILRLVLSQGSDNVSFNNMAAKILCTSPDAAIRNGAEALKYALRANELTGDADPSILATVAAAQAETADYKSATNTAERAVELARKQGNQAVVQLIEEQLRLYRQNQSYRDPRFATTSSKTP
jgi:arylsulfatase A-like enzyme/Tfp pilus assembly protein PilF